MCNIYSIANTAHGENAMQTQDTNDPLIIITPRGYRVYTDELDRYRRRIARSEVTLAKCDYREIDPSTFGTSGAAQMVTL